MSQKRMKGMPTRAEGEVMTSREAIFTVATVLSKGLAQSIDASFDKTKYGSSRNNFVKRNYNYIKELAQAPMGVAEGNEFANILKGFGIKEGQTIEAALRSGIIDASALSASMNEDTAGTAMAFGLWSQNTQSQARYIRIDTRGQFVTGTNMLDWGEVEDPIKITVSNLIGTTTGTGENMKLVSVSVQGLENTDANVAILFNGSIMSGTWSTPRNTFTLTTPQPVLQNTINTLELKYGSTVLARTTIFGSSTGVSGE